MPVAATRNYQTREETACKLERLLMRMRSRGEVLLPSERNLCQLLDCSRETLRRALELKEAEGVIIRRERNRLLSSATVAGGRLRLGRFAFVASGHKVISNAAWNRLWHALRPLCRNAGITAELVLIPYQEKEFALHVDKEGLPELLVVTTLQPRLLDLLLDLPGKTIITTEEHYQSHIDNIVAMDNCAAGFLAARKIWEHGYCSPAMICQDLRVGATGELYVPYARRVSGFADGCSEHGLDFSDRSVFWVGGTHYQLVSRMIKATVKIAKGSFDSLFLHTDNDLKFVYEALSRERDVPRDMGMVTVNSFNIAIEHNPPVSAVSHGTRAVAQRLARMIEQVLTTGNGAIGRNPVAPGFHEGGTLK